ncbi:MAG: DnaJ domain-containing protein [Cyanobacteria bacterium J06634_6]
MNFSSGDYYRLLRVPRTASHQEIKVAFRRLARQYHPDLHPKRPNAAANFSAIREAYEVLIDPVRRQYYDEQIARADQAADSFLGSSADYTRNREPQTPADFYIRGIRSAIARRYSAAIKDYSKAITLNPDFAEAYLRRAEIRYLIGDDSQVLADCQQAIALDPTEAKTYYYQGMARYRLGYVQSAIAAFSDAIRCDGEDARHHNWRGIAHQDLHETKNAAVDYRRAAQLYRAQGDIARYREIQQKLKALGTAGQTWWQKLGSRCFPWRRQARSPGNSSSSQFKKSPFRQSAAGKFSANQSSASSASARKSSPFKSKTYWAPGVSSRPTPKAPVAPPPRTGLINLLRLLSNPAGEIVPFYVHLPPGKRATVGYGLAVLANLCFVLGASQLLPTSTWYLASILWISGGLAFVAMVFVLSMLRLCLRIRGPWAADIFILGATLIPLGLLAIAGMLIAMATQSLATPWDRLLTAGGGLLAILWALSHASIALQKGLFELHDFSEAMAAWLTPMLLAIGLSTGMLTWLFI